MPESCRYRSLSTLTFNLRIKAIEHGRLYSHAFLDNDWSFVSGHDLKVEINLRLSRLHEELVGWGGLSR